MQKNSAFLWRPFVERKTKETFCFTKFCHSYNYGNQSLLLRYRKRLTRWTGLRWICFVVTPVWNKVGRFFFLFFLSVSLLISKTKTFISKKHAVKAAKSNRLCSCRVEIYLIWKIRSLRCCFTHTLFLENKAQNRLKHLRNDALHVKTSQSAKN